MIALMPMLNLILMRIISSLESGQQTEGKMFSLKSVLFNKINLMKRKRTQIGNSRHSTLGGEL